MSYGHRIRLIQRKTFALIAILGKMHEEDCETGEGLLIAAKKIAKDMAVELNMPEALKEWQVESFMDSDRTQLAVAIGRLAKTCEAFDHIEDFPYRKTLEENIRKILNL